MVSSETYAMDGDGPRIGVNGFGRIGRLVVRALQGLDAVDLVAVNDVTDKGTLAHLTRYDSVHGRYPDSVEVTDDGLVIGGDRLRVLQEHEPRDIPWGDLGAEVVIEASGRHRTRASLQQHLDAGAKRVLLTAPGEADLMVVRGVNDHLYDPATHRIVSNASCTTNCLAPVLKVLDDAFGVEAGMMTTVHAVTNDQNVTDAAHKDLRRARGSLLSMIPTKTGAASAIGKILPHLDGRITGQALRVPTADVSVVDLVAQLSQPADERAVLEAFNAAASGPLNGILRCESDPLVSVDFTHDSHSAIVDQPALQVNGNLVKVLAWYDNEWAYACRVAELALQMAVESPRKLRA